MLAPKSDFIGLQDGRTHLATGGQPPLLTAHRAAFEAYAADKADGAAGYQRHWQVGMQAKERLAALTGLPAADHALIGSASEGIARALSAIDWRPGDNVVVSALDYASGRHSMLRLGQLGVEPRIVPGRGWRIEPADLLAACDARTRAVYVSQVTSLTGQRVDVAALAAGLPQGTMLIVDASHALGVVPVDGRLADVTVSSCYKYLCATQMGVLAWNRARRPDFEPLAVGWCSGTDTADHSAYLPHPDARRAQAGNSNHLDVYLLKASLDYLAGYGIPAIAAHVEGLATRLHDGLAARGLEMITPQPAAERAGNVAFAHPDNAAIVARAAAARIHLWDGQGRVRCSLHLFNDTADVDRLLGWLEAEGVR
ncbi:transcriptional regulator [Thalassobaculum fulvum]|uniref:Transcriptional regulator n=1 Tax=Thalassobaculum fulvum TaxID=1633335 RepID=A0A919CMJ2_9PROT|nr:aminotransferase class V-fold PLP-dependent enzyme [Thalassobaculum fulvum]GHD40698.1 transcriptional regulator [Thalassobaculum fulvum]